jgi:phosphoribosylformylglycinamidine cyclo-ligase
VIGPICAKTHDNYVLHGIGPFAPVVDIWSYLNDCYIHPYMLCSTDGPGTIPLIAKMAYGVVSESFRCLGYNVAVHCFCDIACGGGSPFTFMDSLASTDLDVEIYRQIVQGMVDACLENDCRLIGGEMAQLPGLIMPGQYSFDGFVVGFVEKQDLIEPQKLIRPGQVVVGLLTDSIQLNGLSLYRKIVFDKLGLTINHVLPTGRTVVDEVLRKQYNYSRAVLAQMDEAIPICACSNITGGGLVDNVTRNLPKGCRVVYDTKTWKIPELFRWLIEEGNVPMDKAWKTWAMGVGYVQIFDDESIAEDAMAVARQTIGCETVIIGRVEEGEAGVKFI